MHRDPDFQLTMMLCCSNHAHKDDRKMVCRMRKDKVSGVSYVMGPLWMILLSTAEAVVDVRYGWVETGAFWAN